MNAVILSGNITQMFDNGVNVRISIADNYKDKTTFIPFTVFDRTADFARRYLGIGDHISVEGRIGAYRDNVGREHLQISVHRLNFEGYVNPRKNEHAKAFDKICYRETEGAEVEEL